MKKYVIYLLIISAVGFIGCEKDVFINQAGLTETPTVNLDYYLRNRKSMPAFPGVSNVNGMIRFENTASLERTFRKLEQEDDWINDRFIADWGHLPEDLLEAKEAELGFDEDLALIYFEDQFNHQSLRKSIAQKELIWLDELELNPETDPNNHVIEDRIIRTFVNENDQLIVGESIFKVMQSGVVYEIKDGNVQTANQINSTHASVPFKAPNVMIHNESELGSFKFFGGQCKLFAAKRTNWNYYSNGTRRFRGYLAIRNFAFYNGILSTTTSYKKKNGKWKKRRASIKTKNRGHVNFGNSDCEGDMTQFQSQQKSKYRRHIEKRYVLYFGIPNADNVARIKSGWLHSNHYCNGVSVDHTLIW